MVVSHAGVGELRAVLSDWHIWVADSGTLTPLLPTMASPPPNTSVWVRRNASEPRQIDINIDASEDEWVCKRDDRIRLPWAEAVHEVGVAYLRPHLALLSQAKLDRLGFVNSSGPT